MSSCPKCKTLNDVAATRCRACNALLPVRVGTKAEALYERHGLQASLTELKCPRCGALNAYTRFKCEKCGVSLTQYKPPSLLDRAWVYVGLGLLAVLLVTMAARAL